MEVSEIQALLAGKPKKAKQASDMPGHAYIRETPKGPLVKVSTSEVYVGGFQGKAGSVVRNRKGGTRRKANGRRNYIQNVEVEVVSYTA
jgi:hypothetical protein